MPEASHSRQDRRSLHTQSACFRLKAYFSLSFNAHKDTLRIAPKWCKPSSSRSHYASQHSSCMMSRGRDILSTIYHSDSGCTVSAWQAILHSCWWTGGGLAVHRKGDPRLPNAFLTFERMFQKQFKSFAAKKDCQFDHFCHISIVRKIIFYEINASSHDIRPWK